MLSVSSPSAMFGSISLDRKLQNDSTIANWSAWDQKYIKCLYNFITVKLSFLFVVKTTGWKCVNEHQKKVRCSHASYSILLQDTSFKPG